MPWHPVIRFSASILLVWSANAATPALTTLFNFNSQAQGGELFGGLLLGADGRIYGTTANGGPSNQSCAGVGCGTIFTLTPPSTPGASWQESVIYNFLGGSDGEAPTGTLAERNGKLYGTTQEGGTSGFGTVFELTPPGTVGGPWTKTTLHSFLGSTDGGYPFAGLSIGSAGEMYGTTEQFGNNGFLCEFGCGTVYELSPPTTAGGDWTYFVIYRLTGENGDGGNPYAGVVIGGDGILYGTTVFGGGMQA